MAKLRKNRPLQKLKQLKWDPAALHILLTLSHCHSFRSQQKHLNDSVQSVDNYLTTLFQQQNNFNEVSTKIISKCLLNDGR